MQGLLKISLLSVLLVGCEETIENPIAGSWRVTVRGTQCVESYTFNKDGTRQYISAQEIGESNFALSSAASDKGYYQFTNIVTKDNGKPDCLGGITPVGATLNDFIHFDKDSNRFVECRSESGSNCIEFIRVDSRSSP